MAKKNVKSQKRVSFKTASEASYIQILSLQKLTKNFDEILKA